MHQLVDSLPADSENLGGLEDIEKFGHGLERSRASNSVSVMNSHAIAAAAVAASTIRAAVVNA